MDLPGLKLIEVLLVLGGLVAFVWWQMRELRIDGEKTAAQTRAREAAEAAEAATATPAPTAPTMVADTDTDTGTGTGTGTGTAGATATAKAPATAAGNDDGERRP